jgi:hypothetical protein
MSTTPALKPTKPYKGLKFLICAFVVLVSIFGQDTILTAVFCNVVRSLKTNMRIVP